MLDMQYDMPSQIQASTLPIILAGHNLIAQAQSGAGNSTSSNLFFHHMTKLTSSFSIGILK